MSYSDIREAIIKVICFETPTGKRTMLRPISAHYPAGTLFYRVRKIPIDDTNLPLKSMSKESDCWEPPSHIVDVGRLNKKGEALLYTSPINPTVAFDEMKINDDELFSLIIYEATEQINVTVIGATPPLEDFSKENQLKLRMIQDFLRHEFIRDVGIGTEFLYQISESIAKNWFDLPPVLHDAWCYPSIANKGAYNVCFKPEEKQKLNLRGVQIGSITRDHGYNFDLRFTAKKSDQNETLIYYAPTSEESISSFPNVIS
ncbi:hypothetical protein [Pseudomonas sp. BF-R-30]|uniref:hypothetical protein n=1 Tax=Pseudomonas sp. BF-R-30 TaxID=2832384 RepID=UPI001CC08B0A|nr:hypothetical protein [Pseudomonas sp. BF-R-30]